MVMVGGGEGIEAISILADNGLLCFFSDIGGLMSILLSESEWLLDGTTSVGVLWKPLFRLFLTLGDPCGRFMSFFMDRPKSTFESSTVLGGGSGGSLRGTSRFGR